MLKAKSKKEVSALKAKSPMKKKLADKGGAPSGDMSSIGKRSKDIECTKL